MTPPGTPSAEIWNNSKPFPQGQRAVHHCPLFNPGAGLVRRFDRVALAYAFPGSATRTTIHQSSFPVCFPHVADRSDSYLCEVYSGIDQACPA